MLVFPPSDSAKIFAAVDLFFTCVRVEVITGIFVVKPALIGVVSIERSQSESLTRCVAAVEQRFCSVQ